MAIFPSQVPIHSLTKSIKPVKAQVPIGDGYLASYRMGLNSNKPEWQLEWLVDLADASSIDTFLRQRATDEQPFEWTPPDGSTPLKWRCEEWDVEQVGPEVHRITATFNQVAEIDITQLNSVITTCNSDFLCEPDFTNDLADLWISRSSNFGTIQTGPNYDGRVRHASTALDRNGYSYSMYIAQRSVSYGGVCGNFEHVITKRDVSGNIVWTKRLVKNNQFNLMYDTLYADIIDFNDGFGDTLFILAVELDCSSGQNYKPVMFKLSLSGALRTAKYISGYVEGIFAAGFAIEYSSIANTFTLTGRWDNFIMGGYRVFDATTFTQIGASYGCRIPGTIYAPSDLPADASYVTFSSTKSLAIWNVGSYRLHVVPVTNGVPSATGYVCYSGAGATALNYEGTALVFTTDGIYQFDQEGIFIKKAIYPGGYGSGVPSVTLDKENNAIYCLHITGGAPNNQSLVKCRTLSYDLTKITAETVAYVNGVNYFDYGRNASHKSMALQVPSQGNRWIVQIDNEQPYNAGYRGGSQYMIAGGRVSEIGSYQTLSAGGFTASTQGSALNINMNISTTTSIDTVTNIISNLGGNTTLGADVMGLDYVDDTRYQFNYYSTSYSQP